MCPAFTGHRLLAQVIQKEGSRTESLEADGENLKDLERERFKEVKWAREVLWEIP